MAGRSFKHSAHSRILRSREINYDKVAKICDPKVAAYLLSSKTVPVVQSEP
jgi:hypothetical protein